MIEMIQRRYLSATETARLIRSTLAAAFPDTKFSVRTESYSMGASINVSWTDGPRKADVEVITQCFEGSTFDGMTDSKDYLTHLIDGERVSFGADHVFCRREFSPEHRDKALHHAEKIRAKGPDAFYDFVQANRISEDHGEATFHRGCVEAYTEVKRADVSLVLPVVEEKC